jgi:ATP-dependent HslUV protease subunit HslV
VPPRFEHTTILAVRHRGGVAIGGDGQVTLGHDRIKTAAHKIRRLFNGNVLAGFAGASADAFTLLERFEAKLKDFQGSVPKAAIELAKDWRMDRVLRRLEAMLLVADRGSLLIVSGTGDVIQPDENVAAIGSGSNTAWGSAMTLVEHSDKSAAEIVRIALGYAGRRCIYTSGKIDIEEL